MELLRDLYYTNKKALKKSLFSFKKNWIIIFTGLFYTALTLLLYSVIQFFWILGGLVLIIATSALISNYLYLLNCIIYKNRITYNDFKDGFGIYLRKVWGILFIGWVASLVLNWFILPIFNTMNYSAMILMVVNILAFILFNALPETIYQKHYNPWESITYTVGFIKENWLEWFLPVLIMTVIFYFLTGRFLTGIFNYYVLINREFFSPVMILTYLLGQVWFSFMMIYRGYLFEILSTSNRRKRLFMKEF